MTGRPRSSSTPGNRRVSGRGTAVAVHAAAHRLSAGALPVRWTFGPGWLVDQLADDRQLGPGRRPVESVRTRRVMEKIQGHENDRRKFGHPFFSVRAVRRCGPDSPSRGQHLPIRLTPASCAKPVIRTYTLSCAPADGIYRISVKREGLDRRAICTKSSSGDAIETRAPAGQFTIDAFERRPAVLLAGGVGVTPMLAMLRHIVFEGLRKRRVRPTWLFLPPIAGRTCFRPGDRATGCQRKRPCPRGEAADSNAGRAREQGL